MDWRADKSVDAPRDLPSGTESRLMNAARARVHVTAQHALGARHARREVVLSSSCSSGAGAAVASMGWQSRLPSAVAVETRPAMLGQGAASQAELSCRAAASILPPLDAAQCSNMP